MKSLTVFFSEVIKELQKIEWPKYKDFMIAFCATIVLVILFSFFFALVDGIISYCVRSIIFMVT